MNATGCTVGAFPRAVVSRRGSAVRSPWLRMLHRLLGA